MTDARRRSGLRIICRRGDPEVGAALVRFASWLRRNYEFPIRVPVYLSPRERVVDARGEEGAGIFFGPWDREEEPHIRMSTGDYPKELAQGGRDNALAAYLGCLAHEVLHYQQWIRGEVPSEEGVDDEASAIVDRYAETVARP